MLDGELPAEQVQTLRAHLRTCPDCQHVYDDFLSLQTAVRDAAAEPPADLAARIMQQVRREPVPMAPRTAPPTRPVRHTQPASIRKAPAKPAARKHPVSGRTSPLLPISVMAACLALILGATLWFTPRRNPSSSAGTALDSSRIPTATASPSINDEAKGNQKQDALPAAESESVLDDSVSSLLFSVPAEDSADSTVLHISDRKTIEELSALLVRTRPGATGRRRADAAVRAGRDQRRRHDHARDRLARRKKRDLLQQRGCAVLPRARRRCRVLPADRSAGKLNTLELLARQANACRAFSRHFSMICYKTAPKNLNF